ncbi:MAG: hypothetical protein NVS3B26_20490 [Mycobacteriales bacterium]
MAALGSSFQPAGGPGANSQTFRPGRRDPQDRAFYLAFNDACGRFRYSGSLQTIP